MYTFAGQKKHKQITDQSRTVIFESFPALSSETALTFRITCKAIKPGLAKHIAYFKYNQFEKEHEETIIYE